VTNNVPTQESEPDAIAAAFNAVMPADAPEVVVLVGGPGAIPARAIARLTAAASHPSAYLNGDDLRALSGGDRTLNAAEMLQRAITRAREQRIPSIIDDDGIGAAPHDTLAAFKAAGFHTRLVIAAERDTVAAMTLATHALQQRVLIGRFHMPRSTAGTWKSVEDSLRSVPRGSVDRISILDADGELAYEGPVRAPTWSALREAVRAPMRGAQGVLWLGELRRVTDYVLSAGSTISSDDLSRVISLYDLAEQRVLPELPIASDSKSAIAQRAALAKARASLERVAARADAAGSSPAASSAERHAPEL
jgi:hypothetical protein